VRDLVHLTKIGDAFLRAFICYVADKNIGWLDEMVVDTYKDEIFKLHPALLVRIRLSR